MLMQDLSPATVLAFSEAWLLQLVEPFGVVCQSAVLSTIDGFCAAKFKIAAHDAGRLAALSSSLFAVGQGLSQAIHQNFDPCQMIELHQATSTVLVTRFAMHIEQRTMMMVLAICVRDAEALTQVKSALYRLA